MANTYGLMELLERVSETYVNPKEFIVGEARHLLNFYSNLDNLRHEKYKNILREELKKIKTQQVLCVANKGLLFGAVAYDIGYNVKILEAHHNLHPRWENRNKEIIWYYIRPERIVGGISYFNPMELTTISMQASEPSIKIGIVEIDKIEPKKRTVVLDDCVDRCSVMPVVNKFILDKNSSNAGNIVYQILNPRYTDAIELNKLLES